MGGIPKSQCQRCARRSWAVSNVLAAGNLPEILVRDVEESSSAMSNS
ncbi:hypothetical protein T01_13982 [Trichinella spiralis]|uniref:Uncharacterized protein n=1 Tax=Trichinella spiralis TaxID=6334 RepID=A0A0V0Z357_TRISP|nr:hypothetical protein T01_13982 [Trichinella spiralis]